MKVSKKQQLVMATSGRGWCRRSCQGLGGHLKRRIVEKNMFFHIEERIYNLQISLSELISLSKSPFLALSTTIRTQDSSLSGWNCAQSASRAKKEIKICYFANPNSQTIGPVLGTYSSNLKMIQQLTNLGSRFYWIRFR